MTGELECTSVVWVTLKIAPQYEIADKAPHYLRKNGVILIPSDSSNSGYLMYQYADLPECLHQRIVALQWIENDDPEHKTVVHHIDGNTHNNSRDNLQWVSQSDNIKMRGPYSLQDHVFINDLPPNAVCLGLYGGHNYSRYYVVGEDLIMITKKGKVKYVNATPYRQGGHRMVTLYDDDGGKQMRGLTKLLKHING